MASESKGSKIDLNTFNKWGKDNVIGYKTIEENGRTYVNFVWCKVCAGNKDSLLSHSNCKGAVKRALNAYINGTTYVTKHNVNRHLEGEGHRIALSIEKSKPDEDKVVILPQASGSGVSFLYYNVIIALSHNINFLLILIDIFV